MGIIKGGKDLELSVYERAIGNFNLSKKSTKIHVNEMNTFGHLKIEMKVNEDEEGIDYDIVVCLCG